MFKRIFAALISLVLRLIVKPREIAICNFLMHIANIARLVLIAPLVQASMLGL
jgi:hypothetical protein